MDDQGSSTLENFVKKVTEISVAIKPRQGVDPAFQRELDAFETAIAKIVPTDYKLLDTRHVPQDTTIDNWEHYVLGIKLKKEESYRWHNENEPSIRAELEAGQLQEPEQGAQLTKSALKALLTQLDLPEEMAQGIFEDKVKSSLDQFAGRINSAAMVSTVVNNSVNEESDSDSFFVPREKGAIQTSEQLENKGAILRSRKDGANVSSFAKNVVGIEMPDDYYVVGTSNVVEPLDLDMADTTVETANQAERRVTLDKTIQFLDDLLTQAREYATGLVAPVEYYLDLARELRDDLEEEQQEAANKKAISDMMAKLNFSAVLNQLLDIPVYIHQGQTEDQRMLATMIVPQFNNETLNNGYTWLCQQLLTDGLRQLQKADLNEKT